MTISNRNLLRTGIAGSVVTAICCVTPVLVIAFGILGVSAWLGWIDWLLFPMLGAFLLLTFYAWVARSKASTAADESTAE